MKYLINSIFITQDMRLVVGIIIGITLINFLAATYVQVNHAKWIPMSTIKIKRLVTDELYEAYASRPNKSNKNRDDLSFLVTGNEGKFNEILLNFFNVGTQMSGLGIVIVYLLNNSGVLVLAAGFSIFVMNSYLLPIINKINFKYQEKNAGHQRLLNYLFRLFNAPAYETDIEDRQIRALLITEKNKTLKKSEQLVLESWAKRRGFIFSQSILANLLQSGLVLGAITFQTVKNGLTVGAFTALFNSVSQVMESTVFLSRTIPTLLESGLYLEKYFLFLRVDKSEERVAREIEQICLKNVRVGHENFSSNLINFEFNRGGYTVIKGENGAGKTTLLNAMVHVWLIKEGVIMDERGDCISQEDVLYLSQNTGLLPLSIRENITLGKVCSDEEIRGALSRVFFDETRDRIMEGLDRYAGTEFTQAGLELSGGEIQRIILARVFLTDKRVILMDEVFTEIDVEARERIYQGLSEVTDKVMVVISHDEMAQVYAGGVLEMP